MSEPTAFRYVSRKRRVREDRRFVSGQGVFVSDVAPPGTLHVALVTSPYACARVVSIDASEALAMPGVHLVVGGSELAAATDSLLIGVDAPLVKRYPLAVDRARYAGEWVAAVVAESRALAEDARERVQIAYEPLPFLLDPVLGTSNCFLNVAADVTFAGFADPAGVLTFPFPSTPAFAGFRLYAQHAVLENVPGGFSFSNGAFMQF